MSERILFVDDEQSLLNGIERMLGLDFDLVTACSGEAGLAALESQGPFAVVITDMRMPKMDGVQFIKAARSKAPDSVYIMLTGNQDQATAIQALNEGHAFRFLTKPCPSADLRTAIEAGLRQYQLITCEKELLQKTFVGAVSVLTDVLELARPSIFGRSQKIQEIVSALQDNLGLETHWEYALATRLGLLGFALLPDPKRNHFEMGTCFGNELQETFASAAAVGRRIIERIPRLTTVAKIIGMQAEIDGSVIVPKPTSEGDKAITGATLLRIAIHWDVLARQGLTPPAAIDEIRKSLPRLSPIIADLLRDLPTEHDDSHGVEVDVTELKEGMVLYDDVFSGDGILLIRQGRRLTWTIIEKLRGYQSSPIHLQPILIANSSVTHATPVLA